LARFGSGTCFKLASFGLLVLILRQQGLPSDFLGFFGEGLSSSPLLDVFVEVFHAVFVVVLSNNLSLKHEVIEMHV
jgi:hypothetical protein